MDYWHMLQHWWTSKTPCWKKPVMIFFDTIYIKCPEKSKSIEIAYQWFPGAQVGDRCKYIQGNFLEWWNVLKLDGSDGHTTLKVY